MKLGKTYWLALGAVAVATLVACGGGDGGGGGAASPPVASLSSSGPTILRDGEIVIRFSESMNPATLELSGALMAEAAGTWSRTEADNDTYTLRPADGSWSLGTWLDLVIANGTDSGGQALAAPVTAKFLVPLEFRNAENASVVIGQANFTGSASNQGSGTPGGNTLSSPSAVAVAPDGRLFVPDYYNSRVLVFDSVPSVSNSSAAYALGAPDLISIGAVTPAQNSVGGPTYVSVAGGKMAVTDYSNNRVLIYDTIPDSATDLPTTVVGQIAFDQGGPGCTASALSSAKAAVLTPAGRLIVTDSENHRVLVWNTVPTEHGKAADLVLGQIGFTSCGSREATARTMNHPSGVWSDDTRLVVLDTNNSRVLIWNTFPISDFQPADVVLGQSDFAHGTPNDESPQDGIQDLRPTARTLAAPTTGLASNGVQLAVADTANRRVLIWNTFPTANFQPADVVLGQSDFISADDFGASQSSFVNPAGLHFAGDKLFVSEINANRALVFKSR